MTKIRHEICPRRCIVEDGEFGICGVWQNINQEMVDRAHGWLALPLVGVSSGALKANINEGFEGYSLEIHLAGCNLHCDFCGQKYLSQVKVSQFDGKKWKYMSAEEVVLTAVQGGAQTIMISGGEPTIHPDYLANLGREAKDFSLKTRVLTNGYISKKSLEKFIDHIDSLVIGIKGSLNHKVYRQIDSNIIYEALKQIHKSNVHLAISNLVDPSFNDTIEEAGQFAGWVASNLKSDIPVLFCFRTESKSDLSEFVGEKQGSPYWKDRDDIRKWLFQRASKAKERGLRNLMYFDPSDKDFLKRM